MIPPRHPPLPSARPSRSSVWLPWVSAPLFFLLPIGGCGIAATRRPAATPAMAATPPDPGPVARVATMVTVVSPRR